jgi:hypothetical protein
LAAVVAVVLLLLRLHLAGLAVAVVRMEYQHL